MESLNEVGGRLCGSHQSGSKLLPMQIKMFRRMLAYNYFKRPHTIKFEKNMDVKWCRFCTSAAGTTPSGKYVFAY
jgi:hypothetical protein